jgi:hypothetical protein
LNSSGSTTLERVCTIASMPQARKFLTEHVRSLVFPR